MKLIDKAALEAEIEKKLQDLIACKKDAFYTEERITLRAKINMCKEILSSLDTLEVKEVDTEQLNKLLNWWKEVTTDYSAYKVKEVDLEKEIDNVWNPHFNLGWDDNSLVSINHKSFESIAKHFFELGLSVSNKAQKG